MSRLAVAEPPTERDRLGRSLIGPCLIWTGTLSPGGYGKIKDTENGSTRAVHRLMYELVVGPIKQQLDHLCRVRRCASPAHLEDVSAKVNTRRGDNYESTVTHCPQDHAYSEDNVRIGGKGERQCRACDRIRARVKRGVPLAKVVGKHRTYCVNGHEWTEKNTYRPPANPENRICRECSNASARKYREAKRIANRSG